MRRVLVLGATGMLGRVVFARLKRSYGKGVVGTARQKRKGLAFFDAKKHSVAKLLRTQQFDFVVNCIGVLRGGTRNDLTRMNAEFPRVLAKMGEKIGSKVIHISTDAVFAPTVRADETTRPSPSDLYGRSKLRGEIGEKGVTIRTSIVGLDPKEHKGLLELCLRRDGRDVPGYINHLWTGCTTLQLAAFVEWMMKRENFEKTRTLGVVHFAPLGPVSKYDILRVFAGMTGGIHVRKVKGPILTRTLKSRYGKTLQMHHYTHSLERALREVIRFDAKYLRTRV
ncbi:MAG: sugar nucleotide-binding protein [Candidatus Kaiserbacteria bacterium]|nr:MAG: sugar nucleotide-binding protein [Candidatus Kaiserbacteria bacterium]